MTARFALLALTAALAVGISYSTIAQITDTDFDGVPDFADNCVTTANGPLAWVGLCKSQEDGDLDGYGNPCDFDTDGDGATSLVDLAAVLDNSVILSTNAVYDFNCDRATGLDDVAGVLANSTIQSPPGPSGLPCAGTPVCVSP